MSSHPMKKSAKVLVGQTVVVHHIEGWACHGVLYSVADEGIYLINAHMPQHTSSAENNPSLEHTISHNGKADLSPVFFPFLFLPFAALTAITAASAARPPYGYYGGYPGYPGPYGAYPGSYGAYGGGPGYPW